MKSVASAVTCGAITLALLASCSQLPQAPSQESGPRPMDMSIGIIVDLESFERISRRLEHISFEDQPFNGSSMCTLPDFCTPIANPLELQDVVFTDPAVLTTGFCSTPTCQPDGQTPGNVQLLINPGGSITFPANTGGAMLVVEGVGDNPFQIRGTDALGNTKVIDGTGVLNGVAHVGFGSSAGIARIEVVSVGGTGGPLGISMVIYSRRLPV